MVLTTKKKILIVVFILSILFLISKKSSFDSYSKDTSTFDRIVIYVISPLQKSWAYLTNSITDFWTDYIWLVEIHQTSQIYKKKLDQYYIENLILKDQLKKYQKLEEIKKVFNYLDTNPIEAVVIGYDPSFRHQAFWISKGRDHGITENQPVVSSKGLIGKVIKVFDKSSMVLLINDKYFKVSVVDEKTGFRGILKGSGVDLKLDRFPVLTEIEFISKDQNTFKDSLLITSGLGDIYPPGIPVGRVISMSDDKIIVKPESDLAKLNLVLILPKYRELTETIQD